MGPTLSVGERIEVLLRTPDLFVPAVEVIDLLLDVRTAAAHRSMRVHVDRDLRLIGTRHVLTIVEVQTLLDRLVPVIRVDGALASR